MRGLQIDVRGRVPTHFYTPNNISPYLIKTFNQWLQYLSIKMFSKMYKKCYKKCSIFVPKNVLKNVPNIVHIYQYIPIYTTPIQTNKTNIYQYIPTWVNPVNPVNQVSERVRETRYFYTFIHFILLYIYTFHILYTP